VKKYRIYIDETGNPNLKSSENDNHRFLSLTGVIFELDYVNDLLYYDMEAFKRKYFQFHVDEPIIFHRKDMVNYRGVFRVLRNDEIIKTSFNQELLLKFEEWNYQVITILIDKKEHNETYKVWKYDPYHYCLSVLLERYLFYLEDKKAVGDVMIESRGGKEDMRLKDSFSRIYNNGTDYTLAKKYQDFLTSKELKVKPKKYNITGLQIADLIAHPSRRDILIEYNLMEKKKEVFGDSVISILRKSKYYRKFNKIIGYGIKKLP